MTMKNVAGFHSLVLGFSDFVAGREDLLKGLGTKFVQNEVDATLCTVAYVRRLLEEIQLRGPRRELRKLGGARRIRRSVTDLFMMMRRKLVLNPL